MALRGVLGDIYYYQYMLVYIPISMLGLERCAGFAVCTGYLFGNLPRFEVDLVN